MKYKIKEIKPKIFLISCDNQYDLAMLFLRYQEYYESSNPKFRGKKFLIFDYMEWYSKNISKHKSFTYANDWAGFNIPSFVLKRFFATHLVSCPKDFLNNYDKYMCNIYDKCSSKYGDKYYLIGANDNKTIKHELSHAYFYLNEEYKNESEELVDFYLIESFIIKFIKHLKKMGYTKQVFIDEIVAYMSTGVPDYFNLNVETEDRKPFIKLFNKYNK